MDRAEFLQALVNPDLSQRVAAFNGYQLLTAEEVEASLIAIIPRQESVHAAALAAAKKADFSISGPLLTALICQGASATIRREAINALSMKVEGHPWQVQIESAHDPNPDVRLAALIGLSNRPGEQVEQVLLHYIAQPLASLETPGNEDQIIRACLSGLGFEGRDSVVEELAKELFERPQYRNEVSLSLKRIRTPSVYECLINHLYDDAGKMRTDLNRESQLACVDIIATYPPAEEVYLQRYRDFINHTWAFEIIHAYNEALSSEFARLFDDTSRNLVEEQIRKLPGNASGIQQIIAVLSRLEFDVAAHCWLVAISSTTPDVLKTVLDAIQPILDQQPEKLAVTVTRYISEDTELHTPNKLMQVAEHLPDSALRIFFNAVTEKLQASFAVDSTEHQRLIGYLNIVWGKLAPSAGSELLKVVVQNYEQIESSRNILAGFLESQIVSPIENGQSSLQWLLAYRLSLSRKSKEISHVDQLLFAILSHSENPQVPLQIAQFAVEQHDIDRAWDIIRPQLELLGTTYRHAAISKVLEVHFYLPFIRLLVEENAPQAADRIVQELNKPNNHSPELKVALLQLLPSIAIDRTDILLAHANKNQPRDVILEACRQLGQCEASRVLQSLIQLLRYPDEEVVLSSLQSLGQLADESTIEEVKSLLGRSPSEKVIKAAKDVLTLIYKKYVEPQTAIESIQPTERIAYLKIIERLGNPLAERFLLGALDSSVESETTIAVINALKTSHRHTQKVVAALKARKEREFDEAARLAIDRASAFLLGKPDFDVVNWVGMVCKVEIDISLLQGYSLTDLLLDPEEADQLIDILASAYRDIVSGNHDSFVSLLDTAADILVTQVLKATKDPSVQPTLVPGHDYGNRIGILGRFDSCTLLQSNATQLHNIRKESRLHHSKTTSGGATRTLEEADSITAQTLFLTIFRQAIKKLIEYK